MVCALLSRVTRLLFDYGQQGCHSPLGILDLRPAASPSSTETHAELGRQFDSCHEKAEAARSVSVGEDGRGAE